MLDAFGGNIPPKVNGRIIYNDDIHAHNTFENPEVVTSSDIVIDTTKAFTLPRGSVLSLIF